MSKCENCRLRKESAKAFDIHWLGEDDCPYADCPVPDSHNTNADHIRSMSDEAMAQWLAVYCNGQTPQKVGKPCVSGFGTCEECWLEWLRAEATNENV